MTHEIKKDLRWLILSIVAMFGFDLLLLLLKGNELVEMVAGVAAVGALFILPIYALERVERQQTVEGQVQQLDKYYSYLYSLFTVVTCSLLISAAWSNMAMPDERPAATMTTFLLLLFVIWVPWAQRTNYHEKYYEQYEYNPALGETVRVEPIKMEKPAWYTRVSWGRVIWRGFCLFIIALTAVPLCAALLAVHNNDEFESKTKATLMFFGTAFWLLLWYMIYLGYMDFTRWIGVNPPKGKPREQVIQTFRPPESYDVRSNEDIMQEGRVRRPTPAASQQSNRLVKMYSVGPKKVDKVPLKELRPKRRRDDVSKV